MNNASFTAFEKTQLIWIDWCLAIVKDTWVGLNYLDIEY